MIKNDSQAPSCTCPSGDGSLVHPCPAHPAVEQAGGDERAAFEAWATHLPMDRQPLRPDLYMPQTQWAWEAWQFRAALAQPSQSQYEASFEEWLANELEGEDGQPVPAAVCDIALARRAFNHWPKLEQPAKVGGVRFSAGVSSRLVVEAAQRLYEFESTPEKEAERIEQLQAFREQLDPLNLAPHAEAFNEAPAEVLKPEQAERPEVVGVRYEDGTILSAEDCGIALEVCARVQTPLMTVAQHERIVEARWNRAMDLLLDHVSRISEKFKAERDAALARVAEMERQEPAGWLAYHFGGKRHGTVYGGPCGTKEEIERYIQQVERSDDSITLQGKPFYAAPVAQAQHSVPEKVRTLLSRAQCEIEHLAECLENVCEDEEDFDVREDVADGRVVAADIAHMLAAAPGKEVPQAWLDVQAERRRQVEAEGWTPEHDDLYCAAELPRAAAAYILNGANDEAPAIWPFVAKWWKPRDARSNYVRAGALILAEIERIDRVAASQGGPSDA
ncbi:hypothetical protein L4V55_000210 [Pseudomonas aeruginosa]